MTIYNVYRLYYMVQGAGVLTAFAFIIHLYGYFIWGWSYDFNAYLGCGFFLYMTACLCKRQAKKLRESL